MNQQTILRAYLACALWTSTDDKKNNLDAVYNITDFAPEAVESARIAVAFFCDRAKPWLADWADEQIGHDLWLTRNGHGTGFWDRDLPYKDVLTGKAKSLGESDCYIGDNGKIYLT